MIDCNSTELTTQFQASVDDTSILKQWPADFRITLHYRLNGNSLTCGVRVDNPSDVRLPCGLGLHPYFRLPLSAHGISDDCLITVPVTEQWELVELRPTGSVVPSQTAVELQQGMPFGPCQLDAVFTGLRWDQDTCATQIYDPAAGRTLLQRFDTTFQHCVIYTPPHREAICIEPYTMVPDAFRLAAEGITTGLRVLDPGQEFGTQIEIRLD